jgi:thioredoxin reductase
MSTSVDFEVVTIGAGPYGLSAGAHLTSLGVRTQVFGRPMEFWSDKMPAGMLLRSPRVASNIADPADTHRLPDFENAVGLEAQSPVPLETFVKYGRWFQGELLPSLDQRRVESVETQNGVFASTLEDGTVVRSRRIVIAAGINPFENIPSQFRALPRDQVTHCYSGFDPDAFSGKKVVVVGAGQSALEGAALLSEAGAQVEVIATTDKLRWVGVHPMLHSLGPISKMLYTYHDVGPIGISRLVAYPNVVRRIPMPLRDPVRVRAVRPAGSHWLQTRLKDVEMNLGRTVVDAKSVDSRVELRLDDRSVSTADHVLLGTGYTVDIAKLGFLSPQLLQRIRNLGGYPALNGGFESSVPGLHFIGATAARAYGPLLYFVTGTKFTSHELVTNIQRRRKVN